MSTKAIYLRESAAARRFGLKGAGAADVLKRQGFNVPVRHNAWAPLRAADRDDSPQLLARLGHTEFFLESPDVDFDALERVLADEPGAWPVLREDAAFVLGGAHATEVLAEVCNVDFAALDPATKPVVMTLMAGVAVLVLPQDIGTTDPEIIYRIWCDPSFGPYLWDTLTQTTKGRAP